MPRGNACHHATFEIHRRGAGLLVEPAFVGNTRNDRIGAEKNMWGRTAEPA